MKILESVEKMEIIKIRDKLIKDFEKEKKHKYTEQELKYNPPEELAEAILDWVIEELQEAFDFDDFEGAGK